MEIQLIRSKKILYVNWPIVPFPYIPLDVFLKEISLPLCSHPVTLDSVDQYQAKTIEDNIDGWFEMRKMRSPSFPQQCCNGKENSALRLACKLAYVWFPASQKRCRLASYQEMMWDGLRCCIWGRENMCLNRGYCREVADGSNGGPSLWRCWIRFVNLTAYSTSLPVLFVNDLTTVGK